ncbi:MAG TPA: alpha/beta hydrolase [Rhodothermales bacterium]|nr:alpha/beta hydrolase [Rhodothermales bacterium]
MYKPTESNIIVGAALSAMIVAMAITAPATVRAQGEPEMATEIPPKPEPSKSGRIEANGVNYYYEIHGEGEPLLLLHGGLGSIEMFGPVLPKLAESRQVIGVDLHGHGRTPLGDRAISLPDIGDDMAMLIEKLGCDAVDVLGYSMGGGVAFRFAVQHPQIVRRLVLVSAGYTRDGFHSELIPMQESVGAGMTEAMKGTPLYESYVKIAPNPAEFPRLLDRMGEWMRTPYDWEQDVAMLTMPVMLVYGDADMFKLDHVVKFYQLLGGGLKDAGWQREHMSQNRLAILPDLTHYEMFFAPELATTVLPFLNGESRNGSWSEQVK